MTDTRPKPKRRWWRRLTNRRTVCFCLIAVSVLALSSWLRAADWTMKARDHSHNPVCLQDDPAIRLPERIKVPAGRPIKWFAELGTESIGEPVISGGLVWVGTNTRIPEHDASVLKCLRERDGQELAEYVIPRDPRGRAYDWPNSGLASSPLIEGGRLWFCTNRSEVVCLDISELLKGTGTYRIAWKVDMQKEFGVAPVGVMLGGPSMHCSVAGHRDVIFVNTGNARCYGTVRATDAPSLICLQKADGKVRWMDRSPGNDLVADQQGNPLVVEVDAKPMVVIGQGDGWMRAFDALTGEVLWKFDLNAKGTRDRNEMNYIVAVPTSYDGRIYFTVGRERETNAGPGRLCCLDPKRRGDVSSELVDGAGRVIPNPNSAVVWEYRGLEQPFEAQMHRSLSTVAISQGLLIATDGEGVIHCFDALTGRHLWGHDSLGQIIGSPLVIGKTVYIGTDDGVVIELALSRSKEVISTCEFSDAIEAAPVFANDTLYVLGRHRLFAVSSK